MSTDLSISRTTPAAAGFAADLADRLDAGLRSGLLKDVHAVLIARGGRIVLERYYAGDPINIVAEPGFT